MHAFERDDVSLTLDGHDLVLTASSLDDRDDREYRKTIKRSVSLPSDVDVTSIQHEFSTDERTLTVVLPVINRSKAMRVSFQLGPQVAAGDDVSVSCDGRKLLITATPNLSADVTSKHSGKPHIPRLRREYMLPEHVRAESVSHELKPDGVLHVDIVFYDVNASATQ